jgi:predicted transcriptional regulator
MKDKGILSMKTIAQIASECGVTKPTVRRYLTDETRTQFTEIRNGIIYISEIGESQIKSKLEKSGKIKKPELSRNFSESKPESSGTKPETISDVPMAINDMIVTLKEQLTEKDRQIDNLLSQIDKLTTHAENLSRLNENSQMLLAQQKIESLPMPEKMGFWNRLFKKINEK